MKLALFFTMIHYVDHFHRGEGEEAYDEIPGWLRRNSMHNLYDVTDP